ncbi:hypothetical protein Fcan01_11020 [Folsomia candida]|uniref:Uncharacterized protein n=1 Tax=Folsomia candida TaxID=158441 RepID=A0A226E9P3_FOLCA|nr:hypothetical protein Fcan01_11020 [Folsomia candida]
MSKSITSGFVANSIENQLLTLAKFPIFGVQLICYFPLSVTKVSIISPPNKSRSIISTETLKTLKFRWFGIPFLSQFIFISVLTAASRMSVDSSYNEYSMERYNRLSSDYIIITGGSLYCTGNAVANRLYRFSYCPKDPHHLAHALQFVAKSSPILE